jgi:hypothetical protein
MLSVQAPGIAFFMGQTAEGLMDGQSFNQFIR